MSMRNTTYFAILRLWPEKTGIGDLLKEIEIEWVDHNIGRIPIHAYALKALKALTNTNGVLTSHKRIIQSTAIETSKQSLIYPQNLKKEINLQKGIS